MEFTHYQQLVVVAFFVVVVVSFSERRIVEGRTIVSIGSSSYYSFQKTTTSRRATLAFLVPITASDSKPTNKKSWSRSVRNNHIIATAMSSTPTAEAAAAATESTKRKSNLIDGKAIAATIRGELKDKVEALKKEHDGKIVPGLVVILVGNRTDSATYVRMKKKACEECGIASFGYEFPDDVTEADLLKTLEELNARTDVHGILVQLPLPKHIDEHLVLNTIHPSKDVDGLHSINVANLCSTATHVGTTKLNWKQFESIPFHIPCTPQGCIELLDRSGVDLEGKNCVVIGRSNLVGLPVAMLLMHRNATITIVHSRTQNTPEVVSKADIVVAAVGRAEMVKSDWLKEGAIVIDVGINSKDDPSAKRGYRLVGDVDFDDVQDKVSLITPVPGGVGPMTIAMLLRNTYNQCCRSLS